MKAARTDANHSDIRDRLREIPGLSVADTSALGNGFPDLVVGRMCPNGRPTNYLLEVKDGDKPPSAQKLTSDQETFHRDWKGQVAVVACLDDALRVMGMRRQ